MKTFKNKYRVNNFAICGIVDGKLLFYKHTFGKFTKDSFVIRYSPNFQQYNGEVHAKNTLLELIRTDHRIRNSDKEKRLKFIQTAKVVKVHIDTDVCCSVEI